MLLEVFLVFSSSLRQKKILLIFILFPEKSPLQPNLVIVLYLITELQEPIWCKILLTFMALEIER